MADRAGQTPTPLLVVAAAMFDADGRVLVQRRPPGKHHGGLWEFPGGKIEHGETPEAALVRELGEELGVGVDPGDPVPFGFASEPPVVLLLYRLDCWRGEPCALETDAVLAWYHSAALATLPMPPADAALVRLILGSDDQAGAQPRHSPRTSITGRSGT